jgi:hypothetical protein
LRLTTRDWRLAIFRLKAEATKIQIVRSFRLQAEELIGG